MAACLHSSGCDREDKKGSSEAKTPNPDVEDELCAQSRVKCAIEMGESSLNIPDCFSSLRRLPKLRIDVDGVLKL